MFCAELNAPEIYRCRNCLELRGPTDAEESVSVPTRPLSPEEQRFGKDIRATTPIRAALLYVRWRNGLVNLTSVNALAAGALIAALALQTQLLTDPSRMLAEGLFIGLLTALVSPSAAKRYRADRPFLVAVGALDGAALFAFYALVVAAAAFLPRPGGQPILAQLLGAVAPDADPMFVTLALVALLLSGLYVVGAFRRRARDRLAQPSGD
jgi:hypothetical protein